MTKKQKQSPSFSSTFFFTRKNTKSVGIFLDLLLICIFRRELSPARRRRAISIHVKKAFSFWRGNGINGNNTQPPLLCSQEILVLASTYRASTWQIESIRKASASAVIVGHTYLYCVASQSRKVICYFGLQLIGTKYEYL